MNIQKLLIAGLLVFPLLALGASSYTVKKGDTLNKIAAANHVSVIQLLALNPKIKNKNLIYPGQVLTLPSLVVTAPVSVAPTPTKTPISKPVSTPAPVTVTTPPAPVSSGSEISLMAYTTAYTYWDNTPPGSSEISNPILHTKAGGSGTYADPITVAVGHSMATGKDVLDYPAGTKFYVPNLRKYFIAEDTCGDGSTPQNGPCHSGYQGHPWLDLWIDGSNGTSAATNACAEAITDIFKVIQNPASNYAVVPGPVFNGSCAQQFGDTLVIAK